MPRRRRRPTSTTSKRNYGARFKDDQNFALASASLRQALQDMPEITEASKHIMIEETKQGLNIEIVDQDGRSMFPDGAKEPYERTRKLIQKLAPALKAMPYRVSITGHTAASKVPAQAGLRAVGTFRRPRQCGARRSWRPKACRPAHIFMVAGKADTEPLFPDNPSMAPNRRVTITLMREEPPLPADFKPVRPTEFGPPACSQSTGCGNSAGILACRGDDIRPGLPGLAADAKQPR